MADRIKSYKLSPQLRAELGQGARLRKKPSFNFTVDFSSLSKIKLPWKTIGIVSIFFILVIMGYVGVRESYEYLAEKSRLAQIAQEQAYAKRLEEIKKEVRAKATDAYSYILLSQDYLKQGDAERALAAAEIGAETDPKWRDGQLNLGQIYLSTSQFEKAKVAFEKALEIDPTYGQTHYFLSLTYQELRKPDLAKQEFAKAKEFGFNTDIGG